jgi:hypothetical protein
MLEKDCIQAIDETNKHKFDTSQLYRLYMDRDDIADNLVRRWKNAVRPALEVSEGLV